MEGKTVAPRQDIRPTAVEALDGNDGVEAVAGDDDGMR
jgi:hypothetical protein